MTVAPNAPGAVMPLLSPELIAEIAGGAVFDASVCMSCGVCTAVCPMGIDVLPRKLLHYAALGLRDRLLAETEAIYSCLLCGMCEVNCPAGVHITENVRALRHHINRRVFGH